MTVLVQDFAAAEPTRDRAGGKLTVEVFHDLASVEPLWRGLEAGEGAVATPYQRFDWVSALLGAETAQTRDREPLHIIALRDAAGRARILLPLRLSRRHGVCVARVIGAKHANYHMPLFASRQATALRPDEVEAALMLAGREAGIDAYALDHQPKFWDGLANPFAAKGRPCASDAYGLLLGPDSEATLKRAFSADARKKLRSKARKLAEALGPVEHRIPKTPEEVAAILAAFYEQKRSRFAAMGVHNPYTDETVRDFLARATAGGASSAIEIHALVCTGEDGRERILATFGGAVDRNRFSGMWTSFDTDPEIAKFSPGDLLLHHLIGHQAACGRRALDLGVGEARYKASICDETIELVETLMPVSLRGHLFVLAGSAAGRAKRRIKRSPRMWQAVQRLRRLR